MPFVTRFGLAAEHALSRAGRIDQYAVKECRKARRKRIGQCADDNGVAHTHALHISGKNLSAAGNRFVADQQPLSAHQRGNLCAFAAGSGAQIQHALARLGVKHDNSGQRTRLLHIKQAAFVERGKPGACIALYEIRALCPRNRRTKPLDGAGRRAVRTQEQVDAQRAGIGFIQRVQIRKKACFTEQAFHLILEFFG